MQSTASDYLIIRKRSGRTSISCRLDAIKEAKRHNGFFALLTNKRQEPADSLLQYRKREFIELFFEDSTLQEIDSDL